MYAEVPSVTGTSINNIEFPVAWVLGNPMFAVKVGVVIAALYPMFKKTEFCVDDTESITKTFALIEFPKLLEAEVHTKVFVIDATPVYS